MLFLHSLEVPPQYLSFMLLEVFVILFLHTRKGEVLFLQVNAEMLALHLVVVGGGPPQDVYSRLLEGFLSLGEGVP